MLKLRTITKTGDFVELENYDCVIKACSMAELLSAKSLHGNIVVTDTRRRTIKNFANGKAA
tara:strand:+ start:283 stop:465 length:183 start_codon:yes stop_codon:yes gene_type:complete